MLVASIMPVVSGVFLAVLSIVGAVAGQRRRARGYAYLHSEREREAEFKRPRNEWDLL